MRKSDKNMSDTISFKFKFLEKLKLKYGKVKKLGAPPPADH